jgi:hypothetical protein
MSYIGNEPIVSATRTVTEVTATAGQTVFNANGGYTVGYLDVFLNGSQLQTVDFTATNGSSVTLTEAAQVNDVVRLVAWGTFSTSNLVSPNYTGTLTGGTDVVNIGSGQLYKDASGNVGIGTSSPTDGRLHLNGGTTTNIKFTNTGTGTTASDGFYVGLGSSNDTVAYLYQRENSDMLFATNNSQRMRIGNTGNVTIGKSGEDATVGVGIILAADGAIFSTMNGSANSLHLYNTNATNNGYRFYVNTNGGIYNFSGNNVNISDERTKTNIEASGSYLDKICAIPVKLFNYKDEADGEQRTLGVIAQDVEAVAPEFVNNDGWEGIETEDGVPLKTIYTTDIMFGMMKAIQEQQAIIQSQADTITAMEARLTALENK